ncbi:hypothetical protein KS4_30340 [Poriferisphaera corsica]|uniref:Uncharacterized protein n=1 Tax=Poriferisphaera corsica TaxID=2528020 RepID=A0A517YXM3_9BACT|nr:hypothetical protein [Poriferisphaera corsica]QDU34957.1 hypothetical protein KS4_30340 [Poriferisphaera corsica]
MNEMNDGPRRDRHTGELCPKCGTKTAMHTKKQYNHNHPLGVRECSECGLVWAPRIQFMGKLWLVVLGSVLLYLVLLVFVTGFFSGVISITYLLSLPFVVIALLVLQILNPPVWGEKKESASG